MKISILIKTILCLSFFTLLFSCVQKEQTASNEPMVLTIGLMPAVDTAPIFLAKEKGYFEKENLDVNVQIFTNAQDRQSALQTNQIDGAMTDLVAVAVNVAGGFDIKATTMTDGMFPLIGAPGTLDKKEITVGLMEVSVSNFLVDQWLSHDFEVTKVFINAIPARLEAVVAKQIDLGLFPEPIASMGESKGLKKTIYEPVDGFSPDVMVFTGKALLQKNEEISKFHLAYNRAVTDINSNEELARDILIQSIPNINPDVKNMITLPQYHAARLPNRQYLNKIINWTRTVVKQNLDISPEDMVDRSFISD